MFVRTKSILENANIEIEKCQINISELMQEEGIAILKNIYEFDEILKSVTEKNEPYLLSRYLIELAKNYSAFYNKYKILSEDEETAKARVYLTYMTNIILKNGAKILGIKMPDKKYSFFAPKFS